MSMFHLGIDGDVHAETRHDPNHTAEVGCDTDRFNSVRLQLSSKEYRKMVNSGNIKDHAVAFTADTGNPKDAVGATKSDLSLIPPAGALYESQAFMDGAKKYGPFNWRKNPVKMRVYIAAAQRHLAQLLDGENFDPLSDVHHVGHARACLSIIADAIEIGNIIDDRPTKGPAGDMIRRFGDTGSYALDATSDKS